jgi:hypothetical protein
MINVMSFGENPGLAFADLVLGHVPYAELMAAISEQKLKGKPLQGIRASQLRYEWAVFQADESVIFNVRPSEPGAKPVTVAYYQWIPGQDP